MDSRLLKIASSCLNYQQMSHLYSSKNNAATSKAEFNSWPLLKVMATTAPYWYLCNVDVIFMQEGMPLVSTTCNRVISQFPSVSISMYIVCLQMHWSWEETSLLIRIITLNIPHPWDTEKDWRVWLGRQPPQCGPWETQGNKWH